MAQLSSSNVYGNLAVTGDLNVEGTKNFDIPHPNPEKSKTHRLRHSAVETNTPGDNICRYEIKSNGSPVKIELPEYFFFLNKNIQIFTSPKDHFGNAYGVLNEEGFVCIHCETKGEYNVLIVGTRKDNHSSVQNWESEVSLNKRGD